MFTAIPALEQHAIHLGTVSGNVRHNFYTVCIVYLFGEALDARGAVGNIRAAALVRRDNMKAGHKTGRGGIVEFLGEDWHVRGIGSDNAEAEIARIRGQSADKEKQTGLEI